MHILIARAVKQVRQSVFLGCACNVGGNVIHKLTLVLAVDTLCVIVAHVVYVYIKLVHAACTCALAESSIHTRNTQIDHAMYNDINNTILLGYIYIYVCMYIHLHRTSVCTSKTHATLRRHKRTRAARGAIVSKASWTVTACSATRCVDAWTPAVASTVV